MEIYKEPFALKIAAQLLNTKNINVSEVTGLVDLTNPMCYLAAVY